MPDPGRAFVCPVSAHRLPVAARVRATVRRMAGASLLHPTRGLRISNEIQQPAKDREAIVFAQPELSGVGRKRVGDGGGIVVDLADGVGDARGPRDEQAPSFDPFLIAERSMTEPHDGAPGLLASRGGEFVPVGRQVADPVQGGCGPVGDDTLLRFSLPRRDVGLELKPGRAQVKPVRHRRPAQTVDPVGDPIENRAFCGEAVQGGFRVVHARLSPDTPIA